MPPAPAMASDRARRKRSEVSDDMAVRELAREERTNSNGDLPVTTAMARLEQGGWDGCRQIR